MLNLIKKDYLAGRIFLLGIIILIPLISHLLLLSMIDNFGGISIGVFVLGTIFLCIISSLLFIFIDTSFDTDMIYASLPTNRSNIVLARYLSSGIMILFSLGLIIVSSISVIYIGEKFDPAFEILLSTRGILSILIMLLCIISFIMPFIFKFGSGRGIVSSIITLVSLFFGIPFIKFLFNIIGGIWVFQFDYLFNLLNEFLLFIAELSVIYAYILSILQIIVVVLISISLSIKFYKKRDL